MNFFSSLIISNQEEQKKNEIELKAVKMKLYENIFNYFEEDIEQKIELL